MAQNPMTAEEFKRLRQFIKPFSKLNVFVYKLTSGRLMGTFQGRPVVLIEMTGAKSGKQITIPLMYVPHKDGVIIVGSQGGAPKSPVWVKNIQTNPNIVAQYKGKKMKLVARQVSDEEKSELWPTCVQHYHEFDDYQARTDRNIPVFDCQPA
jgi:deazaflavin-dependent oxidoreductase (nitroreductase family)